MTKELSPELCPGIGRARSDPKTFASEIPPATRLSYEIPKPKNWQDFQRACVELYREELKDPHAMEYGRSGQNQRGIDILGRRNGNPEHHVGIQCRRIEKPLKKTKISKDCKAALELEADLKEIIFATTAPDDTGATNDALGVEKELRSAGFDVRVILYGWDALTARIARYPEVLAFFNPAAYASQRERNVVEDSGRTDVAVDVKTILSLMTRAFPLSGEDLGPENRSAEDPGLHAKIDLLRDLFQKEQQTRLAERQFLDLLTTTPESKPWARFRIETNLGAISLALGREADAADRFERAHAQRPDDGIALANLSLAKTIRGDPEKGMELARRALTAEKGPAVAVAYLLQSAARANWSGDPADLIPNELRNSPAAAFGLTEFWRRREFPDWPERTLAIAKLHPDSPELNRARSLATLELIVRNESMRAGAIGPVSARDIAEAAEEMKASANRLIEERYAHQHDLLASISNAALMLRFADRNADAEELLLRGMPLLVPQPILYLNLALAQHAQDRSADAINTLGSCNDAECAMLRIEILSISDPCRAVDEALEFNVPDGNKNLEFLRWKMLGELSLGLKRRDLADKAIAKLKLFSADPLLPDLLLARFNMVCDDPVKDDPVADLRALAGRVTEDTSQFIRYELAESLLRNGEPDLAVTLMQPATDLGRPSPAAVLLLQALAAARRDLVFDAAIDRAAPAVRENRSVLWTRAVRYWNMGDLTNAAHIVDRLLELYPDYATARLLKIDILARSDKTAELMAELQTQLESMAWTSFDEQARVAMMLSHFGEIDRSIKYAYRIFLEHRDLARAWTTLKSIILMQGRGREKRWDMPVVAENAAVDLVFDDGTRRLVVIEPHPELRRIDQDAIEPDHPLVKTLLGHSAGASIVDDRGRRGRIDDVRHKYVARFHYIAANYETRFPNVFAFRSIAINPQSPDPLIEIREQARQRTEWFRQEQDQYENGTLPLALLAFRMGADSVEVGSGIVRAGGQLKVARGYAEEAVQASREFKKAIGKACVLDLSTFWAAWRIDGLDALKQTFGKLILPTSVIDRLWSRRARLNADVPHGLKMAGFDGDRLVITEYTSDWLREATEDVAAALAWIDANAEVQPVIVSEALPDVIREHLQFVRSDLFDATAIAFEHDAFLISDDVWVREAAMATIGRSGSWLQLALRLCASQRGGGDDIVRWTAKLIAAGQSFLGVTGEMLAKAAALDSAEGKSPGFLFETLSRSIGGKFADAHSHCGAVLGFIQLAWSDADAKHYYHAATGHLLTQLIRGRTQDYRQVLAMIFVQSGPPVRTYILSWLRGHFIPFETLPLP